MADDKVLKTVVGTLSRLFNPAIVRDAVKSAASEAGLAGIDAYLPPAPPAPKDVTTPRKKAKAERVECPTAGLPEEKKYPQTSSADVTGGTTREYGRYRTQHDFHRMCD